MSKWITQKGQKLQPFAQVKQMECWIASYRMILQASEMTYDLDMLEKKLINGGFGKAKECRDRGLKDWELKETGSALKMGMATTKEISSYQGLRNMLMMCGPLWVAGIFNMKQPDGTKKDFKHVIAVVGVDESTESVCWINPWKWNYWDEVTKLWSDWKWFQKSISGTFNIEGSLQYASIGTLTLLPAQ